MEGIRNKKSYQFKIGYSIPLINNLKMEELFKNKNKKRGVGITDLINQLIQIFKKELVQLKNSVQELKEVGKLNLIEL